MNSLPLNVHLKIFSYLNVGAVMRIREVCKLWRDLINNESKFKRLRCYQIIESDHRSSYDDFNFLSIRSLLELVNDSKFSGLKYLEASFRAKREELKDAFDFLNSFKSLEETWFHWHTENMPGLDVPEEIERKKFVVNLNRLEKARFYIFPNRDAANVSIVLNLPSLLHLKVNSLESFTIGHPEKLQTLSTSSLFRGGPDYSLFTSLTHIYSDGREVRSISANFIEMLPSLKELHLGTIYYDQIKHLSDSFSIGKTKPKIFYFGFEVSINQINLEGEQFPDFSDNWGFDAPAEDWEQFIIRNRHRSVDGNKLFYYGNRSIPYNVLASELDESEMFGVMLKKFPKIRNLQVSGAVADANRLFKFLDKFQVQLLTLERTALPVWFFEKLPEFQPNIQHLEIRTEPTMNVLAGNFDFLLRMKKLTNLKISECPLPFGLVVRLLNELNSIEYVTFAQQGSYEFYVYCWSNQLNIRIDNTDALFNIYSCKDVREFMNYLNWGLRDKARSITPWELLVLVRHLSIELDNRQFWMRKYVYEQRHSIGLSKEQMRLLNIVPR